MLFLSSLSQYLFRVLDVKDLRFRMRDNDVFIETKNELGEKTSLPQLRTKRQFLSAIGAANINRWIETESTGFKRWLHSVVS